MKTIFNKYMIALVFVLFSVHLTQAGGAVAEGMVGAADAVGKVMGAATGVKNVATAATDISKKEGPYALTERHWLMISSLISLIVIAVWLYNYFKKKSEPHNNNITITLKHADHIMTPQERVIIELSFKDGQPFVAIKPASAYDISIK
jgi:hypothetical protein